MSDRQTRVRYERQPNGTLVSVRSFVAGTEIVSVQINLDLTVSIRQFTGDNAALGTVLASRTANNLPHAKRLGKLMLQDMGVQFHGEVRNTLATALELDETSPVDSAVAAASSDS